jgi:hypothetical protein
MVAPVRLITGLGGGSADRDSQLLVAMCPGNPLLLEQEAIAVSGRVLDEVSVELFVQRDLAGQASQCKCVGQVLNVRSRRGRRVARHLAPGPGNELHLFQLNGREG